MCLNRLTWCICVRLCVRVLGIAFEAVVTADSPSECAEETSSSTYLLQTKVSLNKHQIFEKQVKKYIDSIASINIEGEHENTMGVVHWPNRSLPSNACGENVPSDIRILLLTLVPPFHGSTALEGVLMSSDKVATLCAGQQWQCEGNKIMESNGYRGNLTDWDYEVMLQTYCKVWDLDKPVFLEKSPAQMLAVPQERNGVLSAPLPVELQAKGVTKLQLAYIIMWRPICLSFFSNETSTTISDWGPRGFEDYELTYLEELAKDYAYLVSLGHPVLVVNYADLIWRPDRTQQRLSSFLPCLGDIDIDYIPKLGCDIYPSNKWKVHGTPRDFGREHDPQRCCGYDLSTSTCELGFTHLKQAHQSKAAKLVSFFQSLS